MVAVAEDKDIVLPQEVAEIVHRIVEEGIAHHQEVLEVALIVKNDSVGEASEGVAVEVAEITITHPEDHQEIVLEVAIDSTETDMVLPVVEDHQVTAETEDLLQETIVVTIDLAEETGEVTVGIVSANEGVLVVVQEGSNQNKDFNKMYIFPILKTNSGSKTILLWFWNSN